MLTDSFKTKQAITVSSEILDAPSFIFAKKSGQVLFGNKIKDSDVSLMIPRVDWKSGEIYQMYLDNNIDKTYVGVQFGSEYRVYRCIFSNGLPSVSAPNIIDDNVFMTSDGYKWKYLYSISDTLMNKFASDEFIPVFKNDVSTTSGSIESFEILTTGIGYSNHYTGKIQNSSDIRVSGNDFQYALGNDASDNVGFYNHCLILFITGNASGEYRLIKNYTVNQSNRHVITIDKPFDNIINVGDEYEIYPNVYINDNGGTFESACVARAIIGVDNTIQEIEVIDPGSGYVKASAEVRVSDTVGVLTTVSIRPIISPYVGHGFNIPLELHAKTLRINSKFDDQRIPTTNEYDTVGIVYTPRLNEVDVHFSIDTITGDFAGNETVYQFSGSQIIGTTSSNAFTNILIGDDTDFVKDLQVGNEIIISNGTTTFRETITAISDKEHLTIENNVPLTFSGFSIIRVNDKKRIGNVFRVSNGVLTLSDVDTDTVKYQRMIGESSNTIAEIEAVKLSEVDMPSLNSFVNLVKVRGTFTSSNQFIEDEQVVQEIVVDHAFPSAYVYAVEEVSAGNSEYDVWLYNTDYLFDIGSPIRLVGKQSNAALQMSGINFSEVKYIGNVLIEDIIAKISRNDSQTENIGFTIRF